MLKLFTFLLTLLAPAQALAQATPEDAAALEAVEHALVEPISWQIIAGAGGALVLWAVRSWKKIATIDTKAEYIALATFIGGASVPLLLAGASWQVIVVGAIGSFMLFVHRNSQQSGPPLDNGGRDEPPTKKTVAMLVLAVALALPGCAGFMQALSNAQQTAQWLGSVVDVAEAGSRAYFARHPNQERQGDVAHALATTQKSLQALNAALRTAESVHDKDVQAARLAALEAYAALYDLLDTYGVRTATPPAGGAETTAALPEPLDIPPPEQLTTL